MAYSHEDGRLVLTPVRGPNAGKPFEFSAYKSIEFDPGTKRKLVGGRRQAPIYTATSSAEPKLSIDETSSKEYTDWWQHLHGVGQIPQRNAQFKASFVLTRPGVATTAWSFYRCQCPAPGFKSDDNGVAGNKTDMTLEDAHLNGVTIYEQ